MIVALIAATVIPKTLTPALWAVLILWTIGCATAVVGYYLGLNGWFFRRSADRLYRSLVAFVQDARKAVRRWDAKSTN